MKERQYDAYDIISIGRDTRKNLEDNKHLISPFELVISTDTNDLLYKDEQGNLGGFFGSSGDINDQIKGQVDANTIGVSTNAEAITNLTTSVGGKLDKDGYIGTAKTLDSKIDSTKTELDGKILSVQANVDAKLPKGSFAGTADDLSRKEDNWRYYGKRIRDLGFTDFSQLKENGKYYHFSGDGGLTGGPSDFDANGSFFEVDVFRYNDDGNENRVHQHVRNLKGNYDFKRNIEDGDNWILEFNTINCPISKAANGYCKLANGMIMQWGQTTVDVSGWKTASSESPIPRITFPVAFTSTPSVTLNPGNFAWCIIAGVEDADLSGFSIYGAKNVESVVMTDSNKFNWIAIGY